MFTTLRIENDKQGIATLWMDLPGKSVNTCSPQFLQDLNEVITLFHHEMPKAVIFASAKARSFCAGADLFELKKMNPQQVAEYLAFGQGIYNRIAELSMPTVAAINGDCLGGGCELALACKYRVAVDDFAISIGLPEVKLGLIPAWGGTTRLPRILGLSKALPILLAGKTMPPRHALKAGLVDEVVRPEALRAAAHRIAMSKAPVHQPSLTDRTAVHVSVARNRILAAARSKTQQLSRGHYPAPMQLLDAVAAGYDHGFAAGLEAERKAILDTSQSDTGQNLMRLFFLRQNAKRQAGEKLTAKPREIKYAAVIGGGTMGAGIVHALVRAGIQVRLIEINPQAVSTALGRIQKMLDADVKAGRIDKLAARHTFNRVSPSTEWTGLELADIVVEAVLETLPAKKEVFAKLESLCRPDAVLCTNTSSLLVADIAQATLHPQRVVGLHFFNPVPKMPLVEIVRGPESDDASLATALALAVRIGKTPVLVNDAPGFLVNRVLIPYLAEAIVMAHEGHSIEEIDEAMKDWGMPMGPFELLDEIGLDIGAHVLESLEGKGTPPELRDAIGHVTHTAIDQKALGKKTNRGFYLYPEKPGKKDKPELNESLIHAISTRTAAPMSPEEIQSRLVLPMVNEAAKVLSEHVTDSTDAIDLATVMGLGLAPFRGGLIRYANSVGTDTIAHRLSELAQKYGPRFAPAPLLAVLANAHQPFGPMLDRSTPTMPTQEKQHAHI